jgi:uncharacterized protein DUF4160
VPTLSTFRGVVVAMFYDDHPPPHFHVRHAEHEAALSIAGDVMEGALPPSVLRSVRAWAKVHGWELRQNWDRARTNRPLVRIRGPG